MAFMLYVAEEVREILASLGLCSLDEAIGRVELLKAKPGLTHLDLSRLLLAPPGDGPRRYRGEPNPTPADSPLNERLIADSDAAHSLCAVRYAVSNRDRTFGARLSGEVAREYGDTGLPPDDTLDVHLSGSAGQSFGAFGVPGLNLTLHGEANDYVGKGLAGGRIVIQLPTSRSESVQPPVLAGNTVLYGATGGELFIAGRAGERFAVRNSGAVAVVEGVGDHGCEYMTGGLVVVLGPIGHNFAAGMTGGEAYIYEECGPAQERINLQLVKATSLSNEEAEGLRNWIERHAQLTGSVKAQALLADWETVSTRFLKITPREQPAERRILLSPSALAVPVEETSPNL
jgi:glutamate synthase (ferredoxin)